jgi:aldehyde dehydrogenase (NAD+)
MWVGRVTASVHREAVGRVLVIGPANYPLFLPGVQVMQGLVAGNEVSVKPGRGGAGVMRVMARLLMDAGLPSRMLTVMGEEIEAVERAVAAGVDKVFLTGGAEAGRAVLRMLAERGVPAVMELSGCDAAVVLASADVERAVAAIGYGMRLNGGETCIAPRRLFVAEGVGNDEWRTMNDERGKAGVRIVRFGAGEDVAALVNACPHKLGATIFGDEAEAKALAMKLDVGMVVINDMIAPTADPRVPFGGRGLSGFGVTRGREGLLEMTAVKTVIHRQGSFLPHLDAGSANDEAMFEGYLRGAHGATISERVRGAIQFLKLAMKRGRE